MFSPPIKVPGSAPPVPRVQRKCECGAPARSRGACPACEEKRMRLQPKLEIGAVDDPLEREADRIADIVLAGGGADFSRIPITVQRHGQAAAPAAAEAPASVHRALAEPGRPLDAATRRDIEPRFGRDFSQVRVHDGERAHAAAAAIGAHAFTAGSDLVFARSRFDPLSSAGRRLLAHELAHVAQQAPAGAPVILRQAAGNDAKIATIKEKLSSWWVSDSDAEEALALLDQLTVSEQGVVLSTEAGRYLDELRDELPEESLPKLEKIAEKALRVHTLELRESQLDKVTKGPNSSLGQVGSAVAKLKMTRHELAVHKTGQGVYFGKKGVGTARAGSEGTDCTELVMDILEEMFRQKGLEKKWKEVKKVAYSNIDKRQGETGISGVDVQAALVSECGWKGIFWAPDPEYQIPKKELSGHTRGIKPEEARFALTRAKKGHYYKNTGDKPGYPGVDIDHLVIDYAPEVPKPRKGYPPASDTKKDTTGLAKLKKLPFGVLTGHGANHMTIITYGNVIEAHWKAEANDPALISQTPLENWAVGDESGYHYLASGAIVAPAKDVEDAFK